MDNYLIVIFSAVGLLILASIFVLHRHYKKVIKTKDRGIIHHLREQDRLMKELQYTNVEKKVMEKMLQSKIDAMVMVSGSGFRVSEGDKGDKIDKIIS